jgi:hypothetical protein
VVAEVGWVSANLAFGRPDEGYEYSEASVAAAGRVD